MALDVNGFPTVPSDLNASTGWMYDSPAVPHRYSIRTVRQGLPIAYYVGGTYTGLTDQPPPSFPFEQWNWPVIPPSVINARGGHLPGSTSIDTKHIEFINIPYPGQAMVETVGVKKGSDYIAQLITQLPADYTLSGISQGGSVISQVYDRIRTGDLQARRAGLKGAATWGNTRHEQGHTYTDPTYGKFVDPAPTKSGIWSPNLAGTEDLWWELYDGDDVVACCENDPNGPNYQRDQWVRKLFDIAYDGNLLTMLALIGGGPAVWKEAYSAFMEIQQDIFASDPNDVSPHHRLWLTKPFESQGDTRTHAEVMLDYLNSFGNPNPPVQPRLQYVGAVHPLSETQTVTVGADLFWINVNVPQDNTPAMSVGLNCYDSANKLIDSLTQDVVNPVAYQLDPVTVTGHFTPVPGTVHVRPTYNVESKTLDTGTVWFSKPTYTRP